MNKQLFAIIAIIGLSLVASVKKENCDVTTCSTTDVSTDLGVCAQATKNTGGTGVTTSLQTCKSGFYCPSGLTIETSARNNGSASSNCVKDDNYSLLSSLVDKVTDLISKDYCTGQAAGSSCSENAHCLSKSCSSKKCTGKAQNEDCTTNADCNIGLYCDAVSKKCATQKVEGAACTMRNDLECVNTHGCVNSKCVKYYSLQDKAQSDNRYGCSSGIIHETKLICDTKTLTTNQCSDTQDTCIYTYASDSSTEKTECSCDPTKKTMTVSCKAVDNSKPTVYENVHTIYRWGECKSDYAKYDSCVGEAIYGALYTMNSTIYKVGFVLLAALVMLF
jgi:hypothetical protein